MNVEAGKCMKEAGCHKCVILKSRPRHPTTENIQGEEYGIGGDVESTISQLEPAPQKSCEDQCAEKGMVTSMPDHSRYILNYLNTHGTCKKTAQISFGNYLKSSSCTCYPSSPPSISVSGTLSCDNTPCGKVACNSEATCACPDRENCEMHVSCSWGGWKQVGAQAFQPTIKVAS